MKGEKKPLFVIELSEEQSEVIKKELNVTPEGIMFYEDEIRLAIEPGGSPRAKFFDTNCNCR